MKRKVVIVGAGAVGSTFAYALAQDGAADEITILDKQRELAEGQVLDLAHGLPFLPPVSLRTGSEEDYADAQLIVITAGTKQKTGESRLDLLQRNAKIIQDIMGDICRQNSSAVVLMVTNPVDILTHIALKHSGWPRDRIMGSGTVLDTSRFRYLLGQHCGVDTRNVHAYILGEHGDSEIAPWSLTHMAGVPMEDYCALCGKCEGWEKVRNEIVNQVRKSAYHIIDYKGATNYAIGLALVRIASAILRDEHSVLTVSTMLTGEFGINDVCIGVPCVVSSVGIERIVQTKLTNVEQDGLHRSAEILSQAISDLAR